jgi:hypothetical protein
MTRALHRRMDRLTERVAVGRLIVVEIAHELVDGDRLVEATLTAAGIERTDEDLIVRIKRYSTLGTEPPCTFRSVTPIPVTTRKALR